VEEARQQDTQADRANLGAALIGVTHHVNVLLQSSSATQAFE